MQNLPPSQKKQIQLQWLRSVAGFLLSLLPPPPRLEYILPSVLFLTLNFCSTKLHKPDYSSSHLCAFSVGLGQFLPVLLRVGYVQYLSPSPNVRHCPSLTPANLGSNIYLHASPYPFAFLTVLCPSFYIQVALPPCYLSYPPNRLTKYHPPNLPFSIHLSLSEIFHSNVFCPSSHTWNVVDSSPFQ
jgi:hypothetical protein